LVAALEAQAGFHRRQGDVEAAQRLLEEALQRHIDLRGSTDPAVALRREALADLYTEKGELENARIEYLHGLQILARGGRSHDVHRARLLGRLARLDLLARRDQEAERHAVQAMDLLTRSLSPSHPTVAEAHVLLGRILVQSGNLDDAAQHVDAALSIYGAEFGAHHPDTAMAELAAGDLAAARGRLQPARKHYESALAPLRQFRPRAPETARALSRLGSVLQREGLPVEAQRLHQEALSILEGLTGPPQLEAAAVLHELARLARAGGDSGEAARFLERALMLRVALVGASDPEASSLRAELAELDELERPAQASTS
jgi:tetratricopeptide (TPR) repeat protein